MSPAGTRLDPGEKYWSLKPAGIGPGANGYQLDHLPLIHQANTPTDPGSSDIETYNTFVQNQAAAGHANIQDHASRFRVVGCTQAVDARDNTGTNTNGPGVPIYWVGGNKVADSDADFYDGSWDDEANDRNELGNDAHDTSQTDNYTWTGCSHDGTKSTSLALGKNSVRWGRLNESSNGPIQGTGSTLTEQQPSHVRALSGLPSTLDERIQTFPHRSAAPRGNNQ